jgi:hypothetical protein
MPYNPDSEDALELAAMALFKELGWETTRAFEEAFLLPDKGVFPKKSQ